MAHLALFLLAALASTANAFSLSSHKTHSRTTTTTTTTSSLFMATWSDSKAVKDYQDFLSSGKQEIELTKDGPSVIVTDGYDLELANALAAMGNGDDLIVTPNQELPETMGGSTEYPVYVTLRPYQIDMFLENLPESYKMRPEDFVFFSGGLKYGNIEDVLKNRGMYTCTAVCVAGRTSFSPICC